MWNQIYSFVKRLDSTAETIFEKIYEYDEVVLAVLLMIVTGSLLFMIGDANIQTSNMGSAGSDDVVDPGHGEYIRTGEFDIRYDNSSNDTLYILYQGESQKYEGQYIDINIERSDPDSLNKGHFPWTRFEHGNEQIDHGDGISLSADSFTGITEAEMSFQSAEVNIIYNPPEEESYLVMVWEGPAA